MIRPLHDNVIVERVDGDEKKGVLFIPDQHREKKFEADVVAVGPGKLMEDGTHELNMSVKKGERVVIGKYVGYDIELGERKLLCVKMQDILGVLDGEGGES